MHCYYYYCEACCNMIVFFVCCSLRRPWRPREASLSVGGAGQAAWPAGEHLRAHVLCTMYYVLCTMV